MEGFFVWFGRQVDMTRSELPAGRWVERWPGQPRVQLELQLSQQPVLHAGRQQPQRPARPLHRAGRGDIQVLDWLNASLHSGSDIYRFGINEDFGGAFLNGTYVNPSYQGGFNIVNDYNNENNTSLNLTADRNITDDIRRQREGGANLRRETYNTMSTQTTGLTIAGTYNVSNAGITPTLGQTTNRRAMNSVLGSAAVTYRGFWTVEGTARNDVSSTLPKGQNSYFYPSVATSLILTEAIPALRSNVLSFLEDPRRLRTGRQRTPTPIAC